MEGPTSKGVALFDFDRTLVDVNSGHLWLREEYRSKRVTNQQVAWATWWFVRYHLGMGSGLDQAFELAAQAYTGTGDAALAARSDAFFAEQIATRLRPGARRALDDHHAAGDRVALASSTTQYLANRVCIEWGLEPAAFTRLEVEGGVLTGRIASPALGAHKTERVLEWAAREDVDLADVTFYTDSMTDSSLLARVGTPVAVNPDRRLAREARRRGWRIEDWGKPLSASPELPK